MKWSKWLENWDMTGLKVNLKFLEMEWQPREPDRDAAWEMYIELLTRVATQALPPHHGDEASALESVHSLFPTTREILRRHGRDCAEFTKLAVLVLNQIVRPFTADWHQRSLAGELESESGRAEFRQALARLQARLRTYMGMLSEMAGVEDLTRLEPDPEEGAEPV